MQFIKPKNINKQKVEFLLSNRTKLIIEAYAKYTGYDEGEVVDLFLENLLQDQEFIDWILKQRYNKKLYSLLASNQREGAELGGKSKEESCS
ncbi:MAG: hypothetical protein J6F30_12370 [Cellulosilyticum sp.]|nr:hypothetical protein [Cellulosilyticum sp.]